MDPSLQSETPPLKQKTSDSPMCSCVSMRSNASKQLHDDLKGDCTSEDRQKRSDSPEPTILSIKSDNSMNVPLYLSKDSNFKDRQKISGLPEHSCVPLKSDALKHGIKCDRTSQDSIQLKTKLQKKFQHLHEAITKQGTPTFFNEIYTELYITEGGGGEINNEHENSWVEKAFRKATAEDTPINCNDIFKPLHGQDQQIRTVLTKGVAGIGKTVSVQKFILDWAEGKANQDTYLIFPLPFRELNLLKHKTFSLKDLLQFSMGTEYLEISPNEGKTIFIFDGLDECRLSLDFQNNMKLCDVTESASVDVLLTNLIAGNLLPSALIWITSRPAAADLIPSECVDRVTEVQGFNDPQKEEYFRKRIRDQSLANKIILHLKSSKSLYIMCHIPVFCWISATVLERMLSAAESGEIPKSLNQMYTHFLILQTNIKHEKDYVENVNDEDMILKLGKLAFQELMKHNVIFYEEDLRECGIDVKEAAVYSGLCAQIGEEFGLCQRKIYCFVHLSIQEHLAALYVHHTFITQNINVFVQMNKSTNVAISYLHQTAVDKTLDSKTGHLGLFLRFLLGFSLESNQILLKVLLAQTESKNHNLEETVNYIKKKIEEDPTPEKFINLVYCLHDLGDNELEEQFQIYLKCRDPCEVKAKCCAPLAVALTSEYSCEFKEMNLNGNKLRDAGVKLLHKVLESYHYTLEILRLKNCGVTNEGCDSLASALSPLHLKHLDLSFNTLGDKGVTCLSDSLCRIQELKLMKCDITDEGCAALASALRLNPSHLRELDLTKNNVRDVGVKLLSDTLKNPGCQLKVLKLKECGLADEGCAALVSALRSNPSHMKELNLSENDSGLNFLANEPKCPTLGLEGLGLTACGITHEGCAALASALTSNLSQLVVEMAPTNVNCTNTFLPKEPINQRELRVNMADLITQGLQKEQDKIKKKQDKKEKNHESGRNEDGSEG